MERIDLGIWINVAEAVCVVGAWIGLQLGGLAGAVEGCLVASAIGAALCFIYIRQNSIFRCLGRHRSRVPCDRHHADRAYPRALG
jgi:hypothetical protein